MELDIVLPKPHDKQRTILASGAKRKIICAGRRGGKTELVASLKAVPHFLNGGRVLYGAPIAAQTDVFWETINERLHPLIKAGFIYRNKTERYLEWQAGRNGRIRAKTAYDADTWRGDWGDLLIYDEYAFMNPDAWEVVGAPMLLDNDGEAWFISTPNRKNHFFALYTRGINERENGRWESFHFTSYDNPHLSQSALAEITADMTDDMIRQEIMAQFLDNEGAVFRNIAACHMAGDTRPQDHANHVLVAGIDWGKKQDYTVISIGCMDCRREVSLTRFNKIDYTYQRQRLMQDWQKWGVTWGLAESNSIGEPNLESLQYGDRFENSHIVMAWDKNDMGYVAVFYKDKEFDPNNDFYGPFTNLDQIVPPHVPYNPNTCRYGKVIDFRPSMLFNDHIWDDGEFAPGLNIDGFATTAQSKPQLIENLVLVLEREEIQFLNDPIARVEMEAYEVKISDTTGRPSYNAPAGVHDDTVIARALMARAITGYMPALL